MRDALAQDAQATLDRVAAIGYTQVEASYRALVKDGPLTRDNKQQRPADRGSLPIWDIVAVLPALEIGVVEFDDYAGDISTPSRRAWPIRGRGTRSEGASRT